MKHLLKNNLEVNKIYYFQTIIKIKIYLELADEFLAIYEKCPDKIKRKLVYQNERVCSFSIFFILFILSCFFIFKQPNSTPTDGASSSSHHNLATINAPSRPTDLADSVVPQGAIHVKTEPRQNQPPLPSTRPAQPPLPPSSQSSTGVIKREPTAAPTFSSSNRPLIPPPPHNSSSRPSSSFQHSSSSHYQTHHHVNNNYNQHSRYQPQQTRPGLPPQNRSSQQQQQPPPLPPSQHSKYFIL